MTGRNSALIRLGAAASGAAVCAAASLMNKLSRKSMVGPHEKAGRHYDIGVGLGAEATTSAANAAKRPASMAARMRSMSRR